MKNEEKCWKCDEGELTLDLMSNIWYFCSGSRQVWITPWRKTEKGPMTEVVVSEEETEVILEILEKDFKKEWYSPKQPDETADDVMELCKDILSIDLSGTDYARSSSLRHFVQQIMQLRKIKGIHVYYGNGLFFGMIRNLIGQIKELDRISKRCMVFPATRIDSLD